MTSAIRAQRKTEDGFTLIELLVVVIIIGILAAIAIPAFLNQRDRAREAALTSDLRNIALDIESQATQSGGAYPDAPVTTDMEVSTDQTADLATTIQYANSGDNGEFCLYGARTDITATQAYQSDAGGLLDLVPDGETFAAACSTAAGDYDGATATLFTTP